MNRDPKFVSSERSADTYARVHLCITARPPPLLAPCSLLQFAYEFTPSAGDARSPSSQNAMTKIEKESERGLKTCERIKREGSNESTKHSPEVREESGDNGVTDREGNTHEERGWRMGHDRARRVKIRAFRSAVTARTSFRRDIAEQSQ